jgi:metal-responsive CopG/Arc/MetJ family transcriptional regulator
MHRTNIYLDDEQRRALDRRAAEEGVSRAEVIRRMIDRSLAGHDHDVESDVEAIENSFGVLEGMEGQDRGDDARARHLDRLWRGAE